jgi:glutamyl-Q tRNA(Asp) synthetase
MVTRPVFRFAPSPNGALHLGHALSALLNAEMARATGGRFLLRIEDIDLARCTPEFEAGIHDDLHWLGLAWEEPVRRQSEHFAEYDAVLREAQEDGTGLSRLHESRRHPRPYRRSEAGDHGKSWPRDPDGAPLYPGVERDMSRREQTKRIKAGDKHSWRLNVDAALALAPKVLTWTELGAGPKGESGRVAARPQIWGDVVLSRSDAPSSYHLAVTVDDASQGVTNIVRGQDLFQATAVHRLLQALLGLPEPVYHHHPLVLGADGRKLSKSEQHSGLRELREEGVSAQDVRERAMAGL